MNSSTPNQAQEQLGYNQARELWLRYVCSNRRLSLGTKLVAVALSWYFNFAIFDDENALVAWPTAMTLARTLQCAPDTIWEAIKALEQAGHLRVQRRYVRINGQQRQPNSYAAVMPKSTIGITGQQYRKSRQDSSSQKTNKKDSTEYVEGKLDEVTLGSATAKILNSLNPGSAAKRESDGEDDAPTATNNQPGE